MGLVLPSSPLGYTVRAAEAPTSGATEKSADTTASSANAMTNSMIDFFRKDRTDLAVDRVARDELMVYGVFLSNFMVPWNSKLGDMVDDKDADSLPKRVSTKFFGNTEKSTQVVELNKKLNDAIMDVFGKSKANFGLYPSTKPDTTQYITGDQLIKKMAGTYKNAQGVKDMFLYNSSGQAVLDLGDEATRASFQVLFSYAPEMMLSDSKGLRKVTGLFMDGIGNIWGSYDNVSPSEYVLVMPAALNPVVFSKTISGSKFPVANVFVMGGILKSESNFLEDKVWTTPYYNIKEYFPTSKSEYNSSNVLNIFGIQSSSSFIGNSNGIVDSESTTNPYTGVKNSINADSDKMNKSTAKILLSIDISKVSGLSDYMKSKTFPVTDDAHKGEVLGYLTSTSSFALNQLADYMYYFDTPQAQSASDPSMGSWDGSEEDLVTKQSLFAKQSDASSTTFSFYQNSVFPSPFNAFLATYLSSSDTARTELLKKKLGGSVDTKSKKFTLLKTFFDTGSFPDGTKESDVESAFGLMFGGTKDLVYNIVPASKTADKTSISSGLTWEGWYGLVWKSSWVSTGFGLTDKDWYMTNMSMAVKQYAWYLNIPGVNKQKVEAKTKAPFKATNDGGTLSGASDSKSSAKIASYFYNFMSYRVFTTNSVFNRQVTGTATGATQKSVGNWGDFKTKTAVMDGVNNYPGIYWGYMMQMLDIKFDKDTQKWSSTPYSNKYLPYMTISTLGGSLDLNSILNGEGVVASEEKTLEEMQKDIIKKVYGLLSDGPNEYRDNLVKSTQDSWLIQTHRSITGSWVGNVLSVSAGGGGSYASVVGYINTPSLTDLPLTSFLLTDYMYVYLFMMLLVLIAIVLMVLTNVRSVRQGLTIGLVMLFVLLLPQVLVGNVINISNTVGDKIYSGKFNYWAITQHQQTISTGKIATGDSMDVLVASSMQKATNVYSSDAGVRIKWMSPKKDDVFDSIFNKSNMSDQLSSNLTIFRWLFNSYNNQEEYVNGDPLATYLYRPYNSIVSEAKKWYEASKADVSVSVDTVAKDIGAATKGVLNLPDYRFNKITDPDNPVISLTAEQKKAIESSATYSVSNDVSAKQKEVAYRYWALSNDEVTKSIFRSNYESEPGLSGGMESDPFYMAYSLSTESPFYYFYNVFRSRYEGEAGSFKSALLSKDVFKVDSEDTKVNGKIRDFMDMEGLFTYVIPYLGQSNEYVYGWTSKYGTNASGFDFGSEADSSTEDAEIQNQFTAEKQQKEAMKNVWRMYTPWVDQLYSTDVMNKKVIVGSKSKYVEDTLNPASYEAVGRPMVFSPADMASKSYQISDLSTIEMKIQSTLDSTYKDLMYLTNYYDFDDETLVAAAAMMATFNFNREFSENRLIGESNVLYPQNFELKNFNYDAFMRLTLLNSTGEPLMADQDLYTRILNKTSVITGILLIGNDIMGAIVVPAVKVAVLLLLFFLSFVICLSTVLAPPAKLWQTIWRALVIPSFLFLVASALFAYVISLFMGEGLTQYVGGRQSDLNISDPTITLALMLLVDCFYVYALWRIVKMLFDGLKSHFLATIFTSLALVSSVVTSAVGGAWSKVKSGASTAVSYGMRRNTQNKFLDAIESAGQNARGGQESPTDRKGYAAQGSYNNVGIPTVNHEEDTGLQEELERLSSTRSEGPTSSTSSAPVIERRTVGKSLVDFKYNVRNSARSTVDGIGNIGASVRTGAQNAARGTGNAVKYVASRDGLVSDVKDTAVNAKDGVINYASDTKERVHDYVAATREYEIEKLNNDILSQDESGRKADKRTARSFARISKLEDSIAVNEKRKVLREQMRKSGSELGDE
jgi:hypothetical protein